MHPICGMVQGFVLGVLLLSSTGVSLQGKDVRSIGIGGKEGGGELPLLLDELGSEGDEPLLCLCGTLHLLSLDDEE